MHQAHAREAWVGAPALQFISHLTLDASQNRKSLYRGKRAPEKAKAGLVHPVVQCDLRVVRSSQAGTGGGPWPWFSLVVSGKSLSSLGFCLPT